MTDPTCPECGAALPSCPWTGPPVTCIDCGASFGSRPRRPRRSAERLLLVTAVLAGMLAAAAQYL